MTRAYGVGTVYERKDGRWVAQTRDKRSGKTVQRTAKTEKEAKNLLRAMNSRVDSGKRASDKAVTFRTYALEWLAERAERGRSSSTVGVYQGCLERYVFDRIGGKRIGDLSELDVENVLHEAFTERGLSASTLKLIQKSIAAVLTDAVKGKVISTNVARNVTIPEQAAKTQPVEMPTVEEVQALLKAAEGTPVGRALVVLATSGARIGELLGAKWSDIDLDSGLWRIERTITRDRNDRHVLGESTKSRRSREVILPPLALTALKEQRLAVVEARLAFKDWADLDLVFPTPDRGTVQDPSNLRRQLDRAKTTAHEKAVKAALKAKQPAPRPFPGSFHAMRHFFASVTLTELQVAEVQQLLGHSNSRMTTSIYGHLTRTSAQAGPQAVANLLG